MYGSTVISSLPSIRNIIKFLYNTLINVRKVHLVKKNRLYYNENISFNIKKCHNQNRTKCCGTTYQHAYDIRK